MIGEYVQNCKYYDVYQGHFRKPLQSYKKTIKKLPCEGPYIIQGPFSFSNFWHLDCYNFGIILTKSIFSKLYISLSKQAKVHIPTATQWEILAL